VSRIVGGVMSLLEDVGVGVVALVTAVLAGAIGVVATLHLAGGTPYSQDDLDRASRVAAAQAPASAAPEPASEEVAPDADVVATRQDLEDALERAERLQRQSDGWEDKWTTAAGRVEKLKEQLEELRAFQEGQEGAVGPDGLPLTGTPGDAGGQVDPDATETTVTGTLTTTWSLSEDQKPWPAACGVPEGSYAVRVLGPDGKAVTTGGVTGSNLVKREVKGTRLSLVCTLTYEATLPLPALATYEFQAVASEAPGRPLYSALVPGTVTATGTAPSLTVSYAP
jgi:hypothetical protein